MYIYSQQILINNWFIVDTIKIFSKKFPILCYIMFLFENFTVRLGVVKTRVNNIIKFSYY